MNKNEFVKDALSDIDKTIRELSEDIQKNPNKADNYVIRGMCYSTFKSEYEKSITDFTKAIDLEKNEKAGYYSSRGDSYKKLNQFENSFRDYSKAIEIDPNYRSAFLGRGEIYLINNELSKSLEEFIKASEIDPPKGNAYFLRGKSLFEHEKYNEAIRDLLKAISENQDYHDSYKLIGDSYVRIGKPVKAINMFKRACDLKQDKEDEYLLRANVYFQIKNYENAVRDYSKSLSDFKKQVNKFFGRANCYYELKKYNKAISDYTEAINIENDNDNYYYGRGLCYEKIKDYDKALIDFNKAIYIEPEDEWNLNARAWTNISLNKPKEALKDFKKSEKINKNNSETINGLLITSTSLKKYDRAYQYFLNIKPLNFFEETEYLLPEIAEYFKSNGQYDIAIEILESLSGSNVFVEEDLQFEIDLIKELKHDAEKSAILEELDKKEKELENRRNRKFKNSEELIAYFFNIFDSIRGELRFQNVNFKGLIFSLIFLKRINDTFKDLDLNKNFNNRVHLSPTLWNQISNSNDDEILPRIIQAFKTLEKSSEIFAYIFSNIDIPLEKYSTNILLNIISNLDQYNWSIENIPIDIMGEVFEQLLTRYAEWEHRKGGDYSTPQIVRKLMISLLDLKKNDSLFDPAIGLGGFYTEAFRQIENGDLSFYGQEMNKEIHSLGRMNLIMNGIYNAKILLEDALTSKSNASIIKGKDKKFDKAISHFPFNLMIGRKNIYDTFKYPRATGDLIFIQLMYNMIHANGSLITVLPTAFLWKGGVERKIREEFILADVIEKIIYLPEKLFSTTSINTAILLINRNKPQLSRGNIQFINLSEKVDVTNSKSVSDVVEEFIRTKHKSKIISDLSRVVSLDEIKSFNYDLNPTRYLNKDYELTLKFTKAKSKEHIRIQEVIDDYFSNKRINKNRRDDKKQIGYIHINALSDSQLDYGLDYNKILTFSSLFEGTRLIKKPSILIALVGKKLKPTYVEPKDIYSFSNDIRFQDPDRMFIAVSQNILVLELDLNKILPEYFIYQLYNKSVLAQINGMRLGSGMPFIRISDFLNVIIELPAIDKQKVFIEDFKNTFQEQIHSTQIKYESRVEDAIEKAYQAAGMMKHNLGQKLGILINDFEVIKSFIEKKSDEKSALDLNEKIAPVFEGEDPESVESLSLVLNRFYKYLQDSRESLERGKNLFQLSKRDLNLEIVSLKTFLKQHVLPRYLNSPNFTIKVYGRDLKVNIDRYYFLDVIDNIIENAITHGFKDINKKYKIIFEIREDEDSEGKFAKVIYSNTGNNFPEGYDLSQFKIFGSSAGKTAGTGQGGFYINEVIEKHGGKLDNFSNFPQVSFEIVLPLIEEN